MRATPFLLRYKLHHLFFWMLLFVVWYLLRVDDYSSELKALVVTLIKVAELALMIYITNYVLIPRLLYKKKYLLFAVMFIVMIFGSSIIKMNILGHLINNPALIHWRDNLRDSLYNNIIPHFFLVIAGAAVKLMLDYGKLQQRIVETAREKAEAELNFLKSQINPHFVFNSLNSVYFLIHKENVDARGALHKFSEMLRYQLYEVKDDTIPVEKEIQYLKDYMDLQQLRKDEKYSVQFNVAPDVKGFSIEPLLLVPFVENAFKHISHFTDRTNFVKVDMLLVNDHFVFSVINSKETQPTTEQHGGIGLNNVRRRLELLYHGRHELKIDNSENTFSVQLNLKLS
ncbi:MAG TPA: histidine kinase [Chitinophagaceae bacterium]|jgi:sensor histidine kinase YesM|nr:histidine kinase [Chitinophagaceae bacterium]